MYREIAQGLFVGQNSPRTQKLVDLLTECQQIDASFDRFATQCLVVDQYYIPTRYPDGLPGNLPDSLPEQSEAYEAITAAGDISQCVTQQLP